MKWEYHPETANFAEYYESEFGCVLRTSTGWEAWAYLPKMEFVEHLQRNLASGTRLKVPVGDSYRSAATAKNAVVRKYNNHVGAIVG